MHIGLIGGIGPAATDFYYRELIKDAAYLGRDLELTIVHADTPTLLKNLIADDQQAQVEIYQRLTRRLLSVGAERVVVTSIAGHFCIDAFAAVSPLPLIDLTQVLVGWLNRERLTRVGILGTEVVMASGMYGKLAPVEVLAPEGAGLGKVHQAYVTLAQSGIPTPELNQVFFDEGLRLIERGAEAVLLGGTDLNAAFSNSAPGFPVIDCARIHLDEIAKAI
ncbi:MAG: aspartate/glutamate racemase family protein [Pseudomonadota bacterium]